MPTREKQALYDDLAAQLAALLEGESDPVANAANTAAVIYHGLPDLNWAGFYVVRPLDAPPAAYPHPNPPPPAGEGALWPQARPHSPPAVAGRATRPLDPPPPHAGEGWGGGIPETDTHELVLGPFQGKPACVRIPWGKGVCGTAAARGASVVVPDVHKFPGHIACDPNSRSELVVPLVSAGRVIGVLDLDSPLPARFDDEDRVGVERLAAILIASLGSE